MKSDKDIEQEASKEGESKIEESGEYSSIDNFLSTLDNDEMTYLKGCLASHKKVKSEDTENAEKTISEKDF
jgi:hypothetical protein